jgi:ribosomal protein S8
MIKLYNKKHKFFFLLLKTAYQKKQKFFTYSSPNQKLIFILKKLQEKSLIQGFCQISLLELQIFLRYDMKSLPAITNVFLFPKCKYISIKTIKAFTNDYHLSFSLLNTRFGILDLEECKKKNCGGELIVTIK